MYIYESHLGGFYATSDELKWKQLFCETCGDWDILMGQANSKKEAKKLVMRIHGDRYEEKDIEEFVNRVNWEE